MDPLKSLLCIVVPVTAMFLFLNLLSAQPTAPPSSGAPGDGVTVQTQVDEKQEGQFESKRKTMWELVVSGGAVMIPLGLLALFGCYKGGEQIYVVMFANDREKDYGLVQKLDPTVTPYDEMEGIIQGEIDQRGRAAFPPMAAAAMERIYDGEKAMEEALVEEGALQLGRLKRGIKPLQGVVMVAPLMGLLGTVYGMIASFQSMGAGSSDKVATLSRGIYEALVTTATGLTVAIPFLFLYLWLNRRADEVGENLNRQARQFLGGFFPVGKGQTDSQSASQDLANQEDYTTQ